MTEADAHTRLVGWAKIALPLAGLALLSSLFLLAGGQRTVAPPLPQAAGVAAEQRLSAPVHAGVTEGGEAVELAAAVARPDPRDPRLMEARGLRVRLVSPGGSDLTLRAAEGRVDTGRGAATLSGGVRLRGTAEGAGAIEVETDGVRLDLRAGRGESTGPVRAQAPMGTLEAGGLATEGGRLAFSGGVRLVLTPKEPEGD